MIQVYINHLPHMELKEFKDYYINNLLDKWSKENKNVSLLGDFNINLLNYDQHSPTNEFLASLSLFLHASASYCTTNTLREKCPYLELFCSVISCISGSLRIQSNCGEMWTGITPNMDTFYERIRNNSKNYNWHYLLKCDYSR